MDRFDAFDAAIDRLVESGSTPPATPEDRDLLETAALLKRALAVEVPQGLMDRHLAAVTSPVLVPLGMRRRRRRGLIAGLAAAVMVTLFSGTALAASQRALPGQVLYPVKKASERISLALHRSAPERARLHLEFAEERLIELQELLAARREGVSVDVGAMMRAYAAEMRHVEADAAEAVALGRNLDALLAQIDQNLDKHVQRLTEIGEGKTNDPAREAIRDAIERAETVRERVAHGRRDGSRGKPEDTPGKGASAGAPSPKASSRRR